MTAAKTYGVAVEGISDVTPGVKCFRLRFEAEADFSFIPGQFLMVHFPDAAALTRAYSIASSPLERGTVEIAMAKVGPFTERLFETRIGDRLEVKGPYGKWVYRDDMRHVVLISGGTGITPFRCIARYVIQKDLPNRVTLMYSAKTPSEILFRSEQEEWAKRGNFKVFHTITRPQSMRPEERWEGNVGRIHIDRIRAQAPDFLEAHYFICGPNSLVQEISAALHSHSVPKDRIHYEKWGDY